MGLLDKLGDAFDAAKKVVTFDPFGRAPLQEKVAEHAEAGLKQTVEGVAGIGYDLFVQPYQDAQKARNEHWYSFAANAAKSVGKGWQGLVGDLANVAGGAIETATSPLQAVGVDVPDLLGDAYQFVDRNAATAYLAANLADRNGKAFDPSIFQKRTWEDAANIREHDGLTFGQSFALARMPGDLRDEQKRKQWEQGTFYKITSTTTDLVYPIILDPLAIGAKGAAGARTRLVTKPLRPTDKLDEIAASKRIQKVKQDIVEKVAANPQGAAAEVAQKYKSHLTAEQAHVLVGSVNEGSFDLALRTMMGDDNARSLLQRYNSVYAARIDRLTGNLDALHAAGRVDKPRGAQFFDQADAASSRALKWEIDDLTQKLDLNTRIVEQHGLLQSVPYTTGLKEAKHQIVRSDWYQTSKFATPVRVYYNMRPAAIMNVDDPNAHVQLQRMLDHSVLPEPVRLKYISDYLAAPSGVERGAVVDEAIHAAQQSILDKHRIHPEDAQRILEDSKKGRANANLSLQNRAYDGEGRGTIDIVHDGVVTKQVLPLWVTQDQNLVSIPDLTKLDKAAARHSPNRPVVGGMSRENAQAVVNAQEELLRIGEAGLQTMQGLWKAATLLRVAYPLRVVGEEQFRMMGLFGAMAPVNYALNGIRNKYIADPALIAATRRALIAEFVHLNDRVPTSGELDALTRQAKKDYKRQHLVRGFRDNEHMGIAFDPFSGGEGRMYAEFIRARNGFDRSLGRDTVANEQRLREFIDKDRTLKGTGKFEGGIEYKPGDADAIKTWNTAWYNAVTRQIAKDPAARMLLQGKTTDEMLAWTRTPEGKQYMHRLHPHWRENPEQWLEETMGQLDSYLPTPALREAVLSNHLDAALVEREFQQVPRPVVHGEILSHHLEGNAFVTALNDFTGTLYKALAQTPTEILTRNQAANHAYTQQMRRSIELHVGRQKNAGGTVQITDADLKRYQRDARQRAVEAVKKNFYDLTTESDLAHALRFISPFFGAFQETINTWGRIAYQNPAFALRLHDLWEAPDRAGLTTTDANGDERLIIPFPGKGLTIPGLGSIDGLNLSKKGLNTVLQLPGVGPIGTVPVVEITKNRPDLASSEVMKFLYPYGPPQSIVDAVTPKTLRNGYMTYKALTDPNYQDRRYLNMWNSIYQTEFIRWKQGGRDTEPTVKEIDERAGKMSMLRLLTDFVSPTQLKFDSPYQSFADIYQRLLDEDPASADERFYEQFGEDYFQLTSHITRNVAGIPPTLDAWKRSEKYKPLIDEFPDLGAAIIGQVGGEFNSAVYNYQLRTAVGGTGQTQRETLSKNEIISQPKVEQGWLEFRKFNNAMLAELERRGLERITDKGAEDIRKVRTDYIHNVLSTKFPEWYAQYNVLDMSRAQRRADAFAKVAFDPSMLDRPDMAGVREYIEARRSFIAELHKRKAAGGSGRITAQANSDMLNAWDGFTSDLMRRNASFTPLYLRYFDNDVLEVH